MAAATPRGLATLAYEDYHGGVDAVLDALAAKLSPRMLEAPARLDDVRRELDEYFEGRRARLRPADRLDARHAVRPPRAEGHRGDPVRARSAPTARWPSQAGNPKASRAAGRALGVQPDPDRRALPPRACGAGGRLAGYTGGLYRKVALLEIEGVRACRPR